MTADPRIDHYDWAGGREAMLRFGPERGPVVVVAPPLFEEANRTRALIVAVLRGVAERGIGGALPDLPGQGESVVATAEARLPDWRRAFAAATARCGERRYAFAIRGGALVDGDAEVAARLHWSPVPGKTLVRDLLRARRAAAIAAGERPEADDFDRPGPPLPLAGNLLDRELVRSLMTAEPGRADRTLTLFSEGRAAHRSLAPNHLPASTTDRPRFRKPWIAAEPFADAWLAVVLVGEIVAWVSACEG